MDVPQSGVVTWIGVRPDIDVPMVALEEASAVEGRGLAGDRAARGKIGGKRQVTLFQEEHLAVVAAFAHVPLLAPSALRRNLVVRGVNLLALVRLRFEIGEVILVGTGPCAPCGKMDDAIGPGGFQAMRGHGGITASIERGGRIRIGDVVRVISDRDR